MISSLLITLVIVAWAFAEEEAAQQARQVVSKRMPAQYAPPPPVPVDPIYAMRPRHISYPKAVAGRIVDFYGKEVIIRGVNIDNKVSTIGSQSLPYWSSYSSTYGHTYGEEYVRRIVELGFNAVRLGVHWESIETSPGVYSTASGAYMDKIKQIVSDCADYNLYVVIDWHHDAWDKTSGGGYAGWPSWAKTTSVAGQSVGSCPASGQASVSTQYCNTACHCNTALEATQYNLNYIADWTLFWDNSPAPGDTVGLQTRWLNAYGALASHIGYKWQIIYADWNEPGMSWDLYNCLDGKDGGSSKSYYRQNYVDGWLEQCKANFYPKYGSYMSALRTKISSFASGTDNPVMMINSPLFEKIKDVPNAHFSGIWPNNAIFGKSFYTGSSEDSKASYLASSQSISNVPSDTPTLFTEWGANIFTGNRKQVLNAMDKYFLGGFYYAFTDNTGYHNDWRLLVDDYPTISIKSSVADDVVRPYPQLISGKVTKSYFEHTRSDKRYTVEYSTQKIGSSTYLYGYDSWISVPAHIYPNGYTITTIIGATVQSAANSPLLRVMAGSSATSVKIVLKKA